MKSKIEKLEKLLSEATPEIWDWFLIASGSTNDWITITSPYDEAVARIKNDVSGRPLVKEDFTNAELICALRNCAPLLLEIVKAAKEHAEATVKYRLGRIDEPTMAGYYNRLIYAFKKFEEIEL